MASDLKQHLEGLGFTVDASGEGDETVLFLGPKGAAAMQAVAAKGKPKPKREPKKRPSREPKKPKQQPGSQ